VQVIAAPAEWNSAKPGLRNASAWQAAEYNSALQKRRAARFTLRSLVRCLRGEHPKQAEAQILWTRRLIIIKLVFTRQNRNEENWKMQQEQMLKNATSRPQHPRRAITLIEMLIVIAVIAILVVMLLPAVSNPRPGPRKFVRVKVEIAQLVQAIDSYYNTYNCYPVWCDKPVPLSRLTSHIRRG
jgi:prepilin-type N-terminal cleavage/methylation domain-containing protein